MQVKKQELEYKIIKEAAYLFAKKGVKQTTLKMISDRSYTTVGNVYHYFPNKQAIYETIALEASIEIDVFVENKYTRILEMMSEERFYEKLINIIEEDEGLSSILGPKFLTLIEQSKGSKYEYYTATLLEVLKDYGYRYWKDAQSSVAIHTVAHTFLSALIEISKSFMLKADMDEEERGVSATELEPLYVIGIFNRNDETKQVYGYFEGYVNANKDDAEKFFLDYYANLEGVDTREYTAEFDCSHLKLGPAGPYATAYVKAYKESQFARSIFYFTHKQMIVVAQFEHACKQVGFENYEIVIRHHITKKAL